jgi:hypothetical protein
MDKSSSIVTMKFFAILFAFFTTDYEAHAFVTRPVSLSSTVAYTLERRDTPSSFRFQERQKFPLVLSVHRPRSGSFPPSDLPRPASRRTFIVSTYSFGLIAGALVGKCMTAHAKYGESSNIELPNYIDYLIEKNSQSDPTAALYQGIDSTTLLKRLSEAEKRLQEVPKLAQEQKWTEINGLVTGPLGTLSMTLNQIAGIPNASSKTKGFVKQIKSHVLGIGQAASKKDAEGCTNQAALAIQDLKFLLQEEFE